ncbi:PAS domain S-box protein [Paenibacillus sp. LMG 31461]|uniref:histidine kinase n=1 Tax=Paenibacillus plantarum TaxID=2654975 RepID=A0ABX1X5M4_9BACL|nr:ATP-binding protein [Paenibacillus plantarum]NOU63717.1 PAS domain S-box protein [Paenibacillus plantarum]
MKINPSHRNQHFRRSQVVNSNHHSNFHVREHCYRRLVEISPEPIVVHSDGILTFLNRAALKLIGADSQEEMIGRSIFDFIQIDYHCIVKSRFLEIGGEDNYLDFIPIELIRIDGENIETEISSVEAFNFLGRAVIQSVIRDISARKRNDEFLIRSDKLSAIGQLAAGVAHEIRNPLTTLIGFTQLLKSKYNEPYCVIMLEELDRINLIVNEFMLLSKPQISNIKQNNVKILIDSLIFLLKAEAIINNVQIFSEIEENIPLIFCDVNQLKQVFMNIMKNAIEAMPTGGHFIIQSQVSSEKVVLRFIDQGHGIPKEQIPKLGQPFFTTKEKGTGLGLMVCYNIIEAHKGTIYIESVQGRGTTVNITLPQSLMT